ncbi:MAG: geranylgeranyl reductase family protein [Candidatus Micrarchaeia archaeon]
MGEGISSTSEYDVIVCGGGPGGSSTVAFLSDAGRKVLFLEKVTFPRDKTCGDAISGKSMHIIKKLGLYEKISKTPNAIVNAIGFSSPNGAYARIEVPPKADGTKEAGFVCRREISDNIYFQNAKSKPNVTTMENTEVVDLIFGEDGKSVIGVIAKSANGTQQEFYAKVVVGADGANSIIARKVGLPENDPQHWCLAVRSYYTGVKDVTDAIELHFNQKVLPGYFWVFPSDDGKANVGLGMLVSDVRKHKINLSTLMEDIIANDPLFKERFKDAKRVSPIKGWNLPLASQRKKSFGDGYVLVGDAASLIDPFTGEGMGNALTSGFYAAQVINEAFAANDFSEKFLKQYYDRLWEELGPEVDISYNMQRYGKHTFLLNLVIGKASRSPEIREMIAGSFISEEARKGYTSPMFYLKMLFA